MLTQNGICHDLCPNVNHPIYFVTGFITFMLQFTIDRLNI